MPKRKGDPTFLALVPNKYGKPAEDEEEGVEGSRTASTPEGSMTANTPECTGLKCSKPGGSKSEVKPSASLSSSITSPGEQASAPTTGDTTNTATNTHGIQHTAQTTSEISNNASNKGGDVSTTTTKTGDILNRASNTGDVISTAANTGDGNSSASNARDVIYTALNTGDAMSTTTKSGDIISSASNKEDVNTPTTETGDVTSSALSTEDIVRTVITTGEVSTTKTDDVSTSDDTNPSDDLNTNTNDSTTINNFLTQEDIDRRKGQACCWNSINFADNKEMSFLNEKDIKRLNNNKDQNTTDNDNIANLCISDQSNLKTIDETLSYDLRIKLKLKNIQVIHLKKQIKDGKPVNKTEELKCHDTHHKYLDSINKSIISSLQKKDLILDEIIKALDNDRFLILPQDQQINIMNENSSHWSSFNSFLEKLKEKDAFIRILEYQFVNSGLLDPDTIQEIKSKKQQIEIEGVSHEDTIDSFGEKIQLNEEKMFKLKEKCRKEYIEHNLRKLTEVAHFIDITDLETMEEIKSKDAKLEKIIADKVILSDKIAQITAENEILTDKNEKTAAEKDKLKSEIKLISTKKDTLTAKIEQMSEEKIKLTAKMEQISEENHELTAKMEQISAENHNLTSKLEQISEENHNHTAKLEQMSEENENLVAKMEKMSTENNTITDKMERISEENHTLTAKMKEITEENNNLTVKMDQISEENHELNAKIEQITEENHTITVKVEQISGDNQSLSDEINQLSTEKEEITANLDQSKDENHALARKNAEERAFDQDTIKNLKQKIQLKDEQIKLLTDKVERYWPQRMQNLNHVLDIKKEMLLSSADDQDTNNDEKIAKIDSKNQNDYIELCEKFAESEDFNKSLKLVLEIKENIIKSQEDEISKLKEQ